MYELRNNVFKIFFSTVTICTVHYLERVTRTLYTYYNIRKDYLYLM